MTQEKDMKWGNCERLLHQVSFHFYLLKLLTCLRLGLSHLSEHKI